MTNERTRASEVSPEIAMPMWLSMRMSFFWYEASSPVERCAVTDEPGNEVTNRK